MPALFLPMEYLIIPHKENPQDMMQSSYKDFPVFLPWYHRNLIRFPGSNHMLRKQIDSTCMNYFEVQNKILQMPGRRHMFESIEFISQTGKKTEKFKQDIYFLSKSKRCAELECALNKKTNHRTHSLTTFLVPFHCRVLYHGHGVNKISKLLMKTKF